MQHQRHVQRLGGGKDRIVVLAGERRVAPASAGAVGVEIERDESLAGPLFHLLRDALGRAGLVLAQHADRSEFAGV